MARGTSSGEALGGQIAQGDHTFGAEDAGFAYFDTVGVQVKTLPRISQINLNNKKSFFQIMTWLMSSSLEGSTSFCLSFWFAAAAKADKDARCFVII